MWTAKRSPCSATPAAAPDTLFRIASGLAAIGEGSELLLGIRRVRPVVIHTYFDESRPCGGRLGGAAAFWHGFATSVPDVAQGSRAASLLRLVPAEAAGSAGTAESRCQRRAQPSVEL